MSIQPKMGFCAQLLAACSSAIALPYSLVPAHMSVTFAASATDLRAWPNAGSGIKASITLSKYG